MRALLQLVRKDVLLVTRDLHALAVLFVFPLVFILIMSLALRDLYSGGSRGAIRLGAIDQDATPLTRSLLAELERAPGMSVQRIEGPPGANRVQVAILARGLQGVLVLPTGLSQAVRGDLEPSDATRLTVYYDPVAPAQTAAIVEASVLRALGKLRLASFMESVTPFFGPAGIEREDLERPLESLIETRYVYRDPRQTRSPTAVQQSVPAWLVFSMFLIVIPVSNTFIAERNLGTAVRLRSMAVSPALYVTSKVIPYFIVNMLQAAGMLAVGRFLVPALGGDTLGLGVSWAGLLLVAASVSWCAIACALLVATVSRSTEQATVIGGFGNIVLGALGGVMVPSFVMPEMLRKAAMLSPMAWGLEGMLDVLLRNGTVVDVLPEAALLCGVGCCAMSLAVAIMRTWLGGIRA